MFIFAIGLIAAQGSAGETDWTNLGAGLIGAIATLIAAVLTVRLQGSRQEKRKLDRIKGNALYFRGISEKDSFSALDMFKVLDLRDSPGLQEGREGTAVLNDSHVIVREGDRGNGVVFCYATSGRVSGVSDRNAYEWGEIDPHSPLKRNVQAKSFALGVDLDDLSTGQATRITNQVVYGGAFDDAEGESFETHIDRNTPSLTFLLLFSPAHPCLSVKGEVDVGRDQWVRADKNRPVILNGGAMLYWRVFPDNGDNSLRHMAKYRLRWTWRPSGRPESGEMTSANVTSPSIES